MDFVHKKMEDGRLAANDSNAVAAGEGVLSIPARIYREYSDEFRELARSTTNSLQQAIYLKMANTWAEAAIQFETGLETSDLNLSEAQ
jgi:hypothetical protein